MMFMCLDAFFIRLASFFLSLKREHSDITTLETKAPSGPPTMILAPQTVHLFLSITANSMRTISRATCDYFLSVIYS